jgi:5'-3' exonuclease
MLLNIIEIENPDYLIMTFDLHKSFRHKKDPTYKAQRKPAPEDLVEQFPKIYDMVEKM